MFGILLPPTSPHLLRSAATGCYALARRSCSSRSTSVRAECCLTRPSLAPTRNRGETGVKFGFFVFSARRVSDLMKLVWTAPATQYLGSLAQSQRSLDEV